MYRLAHLTRCICLPVVSLSYKLLLLIHSYDFDVAGKESVKIALLASVPVVSPGISAGGGISAGWWSSSNSGIFEHAHKPGASFFPLYASKTLKAKARRGSPGTDNADEDL